MTADVGPARDEGLAPAIDFMPLATLVGDREGRVLAVNPAWAQLSGLSEADSLGDGWVRLLREPDRPRLLRTLKRVSDCAGLETLELELDGGPEGRWTRWTIRRHDYQGRPVVVMVVVDLDAEHTLQVDLRHRATHDALTGLVNRAEFLELTARAMGRQEGQVGIVYLDLDRFKEVNDQGGHQLGDRVLAATARRLRAGVRPSDVVGRVGGDEFAVLCYDLHDTAHLETVAGRLRAVLKAPLDVDGGSHRVGATTGVAVSTSGCTPEEVLDAADRAMYAAKSRRRSSPVSAAAPVGDRVPAADTGRGRPAPAASELETDESEELMSHLLNARISLETCATSMVTGSVDDLWSAIDEVDTVLAFLRRNGGSRLSLFRPEHGRHAQS